MTRAAATALLALALAGALAGCGKYGAPVRSRAAAEAAQEEPQSTDPASDREEQRD